MEQKITQLFSSCFTPFVLFISSYRSTFVIYGWEEKINKSSSIGKRALMISVPGTPLPRVVMSSRNKYVTQTFPFVISSKLIYYCTQRLTNLFLNAACYIKLKTFQPISEPFYMKRKIYNFDRLVFTREKRSQKVIFLHRSYQAITIFAKLNIL